MFRKKKADSFSLCNDSDEPQSLLAEAVNEATLMALLFSKLMDIECIV